MKKLCMLLVIVLLLSGCGQEPSPPETAATEDTTASTEASETTEEIPATQTEAVNHSYRGEDWDSGYEAPSAPIIREGALGASIEAIRQDVDEYVRVSGTFISREHTYIELPQKNASEIRWNVQVGDEIQVNQVLGTYNGDDILSAVDGILVEINTYSAKPYLQIQLLTGLELECNLSEKLIKQLRRAEALTTQDGTPVTMTYIANVKNDDGSSRVLLKLEEDSHFYGEAVKDLKLYTGYVYTGALVLPEKCLYQKNVGDDQPWYVRQVTEDGYFLEELEVQRGYSNGELVCVTGIEEGTFYDNGYQVIAEG